MCMFNARLLRTVLLTNTFGSYLIFSRRLELTNATNAATVAPTTATECAPEENKTNKCDWWRLLEKRKNIYHSNKLKWTAKNCIALNKLFSNYTRSRHAGENSFFSSSKPGFVPVAFYPGAVNRYYNIYLIYYNNIYLIRPDLLKNKDSIEYSKDKSSPAKCVLCAG